MNKDRREQLSQVSDLLNEALDILEDIRSEEEEAFENIPEPLQCGSQGNSMQDAIEMMESWADKLNDISNIISSFSAGKLTTAEATISSVQKSENQTKTYSCVASNHSITLNEYSDRALVIRGNTRDIKEKLKEFGATFNGGLNGGPGWIISKKHEEKFRKEFAQFI